MGAVYRARFVKDDRQVALKFLSSEYSDDQVVLARFGREMDALKQLKHPNIVTCFGGVCKTKQPFYAMELVEGGSIEQLLKERGSFSWERAVEFGLQLCSALSYAHERGIIHRDVKPSNLLLTKSGQLKLSDFGLVYVTGATRLTNAGKTMGSFRYMAPERYEKDNAATPQTDLYSLGCVLYEMIAGQCPVSGETPAEILRNIMEETPPRLPALKPDCPAKLDRLVIELLEKSAGDRPASAAEVSLKLKRIHNVISVKATKPEGRAGNKPTRLKRPEVPNREEPRRRRRLPAWMVWVASLLIASLAIWNVALLSSLAETNRYLARAENQWLQMYRSGDVQSQLRAAEALGQLGHGSDALVAAFTEGLEHNQDNEVRKATIEALGELGVSAKRTAAKLHSLQQDDPDRDVRGIAKAALQKIRAAESAWSLWKILLAVLSLAVLVVAIGFWLRRMAPAAPDAGSEGPVNTLASRWLKTETKRQQ